MKVAILGADGIHSKVRTYVIPTSYPAINPCAFSLYCLKLPMDVFKDSIGAHQEISAMFNDNQDVFIAFLAAGKRENRDMVICICRRHRHMNLAYAISDPSLNSAARLEYSWNATGSVNETVHSIQSFTDQLQRVFRPGRINCQTLHRFTNNNDRCAVVLLHVQLFQVRGQESLPTYVKGQVVLIGNAAHVMVFYQTQGSK